MAHREVHDALRELGLDVAALLTEEVKAGAELPFVIEEQGRDSVLYSYTALTADFIGARWRAIRELPGYVPAERVLGPGAAAYLRHRGLAGDGAGSVLRDLLERLYSDATTFAFPEERFEGLCAELEQAISDGQVATVVAVPVYGVRIAGRRVDLDDCLALVSARTIDLPRQALDPPGRVELDDGLTLEAGGLAPSVVAAFELRLAPDAPFPLVQAGEGFGRLLTALRLAGADGAAVGSIAWARTGAGAWHALPLAFPGPNRHEWWQLTDDDELRELLEVVGRPHDGAVAWALDRFDMGCARVIDAQALSDFLLALRALLADSGAGGGLPMRLAALCAVEGDRRGVQARVELSLALERFVVTADGRDYVDVVGTESPADIVAELRQYLRALLRDVLCGYLPSDLRSTADEILLARDGEAAPRAAPSPTDATPARTAPTPRPAPGVDEAAWPPGAKADVPIWELDTEEFDAIRVHRFEPPDERRDAAGAGVEDGDAASPVGVTPSADWGLDDDADSYSAPV